MAKKVPGTSNVYRLRELIPMMHYTTESREVFFDKPFETLEDVIGFKDWLNKKHVMDSRILSPEGDVLTYEDCIGRNHFIFSEEVIALCTDRLKIFQPKTRTLLTAGTEEQVSLILKRSEKVA